MHVHVRCGFCHVSIIAKLQIQMEGWQKGNSSFVNAVYALVLKNFVAVRVLLVCSYVHLLPCLDYHSPIPNIGGLRGASPYILSNFVNNNTE